MTRPRFNCVGETEGLGCAGCTFALIAIVRVKPCDSVTVSAYCAFVAPVAAVTAKAKFVWLAALRVEGTLETDNVTPEPETCWRVELIPESAFWPELTSAALKFRLLFCDSVAVKFEYCRFIPSTVKLPCGVGLTTAG